MCPPWVYLYVKHWLLDEQHLPSDRSRRLVDFATLGLLVLRRRGGVRLCFCGGVAAQDGLLLYCGGSYTVLGDGDGFGILGWAGHFVTFKRGFSRFFKESF
jgi:hypothetical protein